MTHDLLIRARGATITTALLLTEHLTLWDLRDRLPLVARYALGTSAIGAGMAYCAAARRDWRGAGDFWTCVIAGGSLVIAAHLIRETQEQPADRLLKRALGESNGVRRYPNRTD